MATGAACVAFEIAPRRSEKRTYRPRPRGAPRGGGGGGGFFHSLQVGRESCLVYVTTAAGCVAVVS